MILLTRIRRPLLVAAVHPSVADQVVRCRLRCRAGALEDWQWTGA
jgi:hypothetical protein